MEPLKKTTKTKPVFQTVIQRNKITFSSETAIIFSALNFSQVTN